MGIRMQHVQQTQYVSLTLPSFSAWLPVVDMAILPGILPRVLKSWAPLVPIFLKFFITDWLCKPGRPVMCFQCCDITQKNRFQSSFSEWPREWSVTDQSWMFIKLEAAKAEDVSPFQSFIMHSTSTMNPNRQSAKKVATWSLAWLHKYHLNQLTCNRLLNTCR